MFGLRDNDDWAARLMHRLVRDNRRGGPTIKCWVEKEMEIDYDTSVLIGHLQVNKNLRRHLAENRIRSPLLVLIGFPGWRSFLEGSIKPVQSRSRIVLDSAELYNVWRVREGC